MYEILNFLENSNKYINIDYIETYFLPEGKKEITCITAQKDGWSICITVEDKYFLLCATLGQLNSTAYETLIDGWENVLRELEYENYCEEAFKRQ